MLGGHSLGGSITTAYATWDFDGRPGAKGLAGLVFIDGGSGPTPVTAGRGDASAARAARPARPWLAFGGIAAPFAGLFNSSGSALVADRARRAVARPGAGRLLPANLKPPVPATNAGQYGYALDTDDLARRRSPRRRRTSAGSPRAATRAAGTTPAS